MDVEECEEDDWVGGAGGAGGAGEAGGIELYGLWEGEGGGCWTLAVREPMVERDERMAGTEERSTERERS